MPTTIAVDVAKTIFEVAVSEHPGRVRERHRLTRAQFARFVATQPAATIVMEACGTAHFWGRHATAHGHDAILLPPHAVRPYVPRNKTDRADAKGLLEALRNKAIHPVPVKTLPQQTLAALHRLRSTWLATRTAPLNTVRGLLRELGIPIPLGAHRVVPTVRHALHADGAGIPSCGSCGARSKHWFRRNTAAITRNSTRRAESARVPKRQGSDGGSRRMLVCPLSARRRGDGVLCQHYVNRA